ncbi:murein biosynthesis integral membrane protein MurJ [Tissierella sp. MB52-C2]|uniref:murein biosynthesis integral membrane protein MurJ n=1 Tax=Tissierella sp. MB52-C2 TaxID=3070999 RepID=UPI00280B714C|nr:murein biosynthesis integral membrane protein MurJ [Tissierella sp. MB52-C2]WMM24319.1 murein biosynthesis integral membrane protein MurJ [Tissierella sp. MB52-C2]
MNKSNKTAKSALIIIIFSLGSKFLGFIREVLIAAKFGSGMETDTFFIALSASALIGGFLQNAINTTFIPVISEVESKEGKKGKIEHTNNMINIIFFVSLILTVVALLGTPMLVKLLASGFEDEQFDLAVKLTRIGLPMILFSGVIGVMTGYLQSEQKFNATAIIGFPYNFVNIFFLLFLSSIFGIKGLMVTRVVAVFSQLLVQIPEARASGFRYKFIFDIKDKYIRKALYLSLPILIGVAINDLNAIVDRTLASSLVLGSISALNYANKLNGLVLGVFISAITTVIFPVLSKEANNENIDGVKSTMGYGINLILLITVPATVGMIVLAKPIVEIAFQRGEFDATATLMTSQALIFYSIGLVASALRLLVTRVYYSLQDTKTPMINGAISVGFNIVLNLILVKYMAHAGLALATSIAITIATIMLLYGLKKKIGSLGTKEYMITFLKTGLASVIMGLVAYIVYYVLYGILGASKLYNLVSLLVAVGLAVIVYGVLCYLFRIDEVRDMVDRIRERFRLF